MTVGLIIVTHDAEAFIRRAIDAVARQTRQPDRVVIVDNASRDRTVAVVEEAIRGWTIPVRVIDAGGNIGFAAANNRGVAALGACDLVALLNPDAFPEPGWLAALVAAADRHPDAASFASRLMLDGRPDHLDGAGDVCHASGAVVWRHGHGQPLAAVPDASTSRPAFAACGAAVLYRRTDWDHAGGLDEHFFCNTEDVDLGFRLQLAGRRCWYEADAVVHHMGSATTVVGSAFNVYYGNRNVEWVFLKNMPASLMWRYLPWHLLVWLVAFLWFSTRGRGGTFLRAKWHALRGAPDMWRSRRLVQQRRTLTAAEVRGLLDRSSLVGRFLARARSNAA
jgi:GT2 family glycosyltransferase